MAELLSIDTLIERPRVKIDGEVHEILSPDELSLLASQRVAALGRKLDKLMKADTLNATGEADLSKTIWTLSDVIMEPVPNEVRYRLSETQLLSVIEVFTMLSLGRKAKLAGATVAGMATQTAPGTSDGAKPSPGSSDTSAATPRAG